MVEAEAIIKCALEQYGRSGLKFTVDDVASALHISKKSMYKIFKTRKKLDIAILEYIYQDIHSQYVEILQNGMSSLEKLMAIIKVYPKCLPADKLSFKAAVEENNYISEKLKEHYNRDWETEFMLLDQCVEEGVIKPIRMNALKR